MLTRNYSLERLHVGLGGAYSYKIVYSDVLLPCSQCFAAIGADPIENPN
jgi:hypothetical protein